MIGIIVVINDNIAGKNGRSICIAVRTVLLQSLDTDVNMKEVKSLQQMDDFLLYANGHILKKLLG